MSFITSTTGNEATRKFIEILQQDFKTLSQEARRKYPHVKESCEEAIAKLSSAVTDQQVSVYYVVNQILYPLVQGCETKDAKIIKFCLGMMQRLITQQVVDQKGARYITDALWVLMETNTEEVKVIQTVTLLLTTNSIVHGDTLSKALVLCFRLYFAKDMTTVNTACATIRQLVSLVFERLVINQQAKEKALQLQQSSAVDDKMKGTTGRCNIEEAGAKDCESDALNLFQDLVQLVNADQPFWLHGMTEMTRTFGLELLENILTKFSSIFYDIEQFRLLLKERVCALIIKLFSPNIKQRPVIQTGVSAEIAHDKPYFPISVRLLRLVSVIIERYQKILVTECEIFLSLIVKFLEPDKPSWQRALALEVIHRICAKPDLLASFVECYDMKDHSTNIFQDIVNSLGTYVQSLFLNMPASANGQLAGGSSNVYQTNTSASLQPGFMLRGVWLQLVAIFPSGQPKSTYLEMLEKMEPPSIPDGYGISLAYASLLDIINSISIYFYSVKQDKQKKAVSVQMINSSWFGLLTALTPLLDATVEETTTENLLKAMQMFVALTGEQDITTPRDAFVITICKAALPVHYALAAFENAIYQGTDIKYFQRPSSNQDICNQTLGGHCGENDFRHQVVAVGTPLPTPFLPMNSNSQGPVMLTVKNLQCMRALLRTANCHGKILGASWHIVLCTLQHLVWILGLKPSTGGSLQATAKPSFDTNVSIQTAVITDLPILSQMLSELFESSIKLDDVALHHLIDALCKLSQEAMELAYNNREPSLFAVAKLLETGLVNLPRIEVLWRPLTNHLLEVCQHRHIRMREWGVEAITYLVKAALQYKYEIPLKNNMVLQTLLLSPLAELSTVPHADVRQRQLECVLQILNGAGETLSYGWPAILGIIGAVNDHHGEALIRIAFQCLQLVVTDFLPAMPWQCLPLCVNTASNFGSQTQDLNISLTAVGLMWNISDYFSQSQDKLVGTDDCDKVVLPDFPGIVELPQIDKLWMCLYTKLGNLCVDLRPAVRKSAGQTLFSTISAHGNLLSASTWQAVLWQVLFPLLDKVRTLSSSASNEKVDTSGNILIHHSRNTAQKQWAETEVLSLSGVSRVFNTKRQLLQTLGDFPKAWTLLLEFIESSALSHSYEVSLAALKSFQEMLYNRTESTTKQTNGANDKNFDLWKIAWEIWLKIGIESTSPTVENVCDKIEDLYIPSQAFLTALVQTFPALFQHIRNRFKKTDLDRLCTVLMNAVILPVQSDATPYIMSTLTDTQLTPLHDGILECIDILQKEALSDGNHLREMIPDIFKQLLIFSEFACVPPTVNNLIAKFYNKSSSHCGRGSKSDYSTLEWVCLNYIPFSEKSLSTVVKLYNETAYDLNVIEKHILHEIIKTLKIPLGLKYKCASSSTWKLAISGLLSVLKVGFQVARTKQFRAYFTSLWDDLADVLNQFLFPKSECIVEDRGLEEIVLDEAIDCQVIDLMREEILPYSSDIPQTFVLKMIMILNKGSIHTATGSDIVPEPDWKLREVFAKTCFETLLQFSLLDDSNCITGNEESEFAGRLAVTALLHRFQEVVKRFNDEERLSGKFPLPRYRLTEISFVLKAVATLIKSMKKAPANKVSKAAWDQLITLYPYLVDCTSTTSSDVLKSLREALLQYGDLLKAPPLIAGKNNNNMINNSGPKI